MLRPLYADTIYEELFTNETEIPRNVASIGWTSYKGSTAEDVTTGTYKTHVTKFAGNPAEPKGFLGVNNGGEDFFENVFAVVTDLPKNVDLTETVISWTMGNNNKRVTVQLLIQIGKEWYASEKTFSNSVIYKDGEDFAGASTEEVTQSLDFSPNASHWRHLVLAPGSSLSLGDKPNGNLPSAKITGIGFLVTTPDQKVFGRLDTLRISSGR